MNPQGNSVGESNTNNVANNENEVIPLPLFPLTAEGESPNVSPTPQNPSDDVDLSLNLGSSESDHNVTTSPVVNGNDNIVNTISTRTYLRRTLLPYSYARAPLHGHESTLVPEIGTSVPIHNTRTITYHYHPLSYQELMGVLYYDFVIEEENHPEPVEELQAGLSVETITQHLESEVFVSVDNDASEKCPICQEEFEDGAEIGKLHKCVHKFHVDCIKQWLVCKNSCPVCIQTALEINES